MNFTDKRLLLALLQSRWAEAEQICNSQPVDARTFAKLCERCEVAPWIHSLLSREQRLPAVRAALIEALKPMRQTVRKHSLMLITQAERAIDALLEAGVVPVALKGLDLVHRVYEFDEREMRDLDLLVTARDLPRAIDALQAAGWAPPDEPERTHYIRSSHHLRMTSTGATQVLLELHWNVVQETRFRVDLRGLWERAVPLDIGGRQVLRFEDHDLVAHLLLHHFTHYFDRRLKWAVDLEKIAAQPGFRWEVVVERLRSWGATASAGAAVMHLRKCVPDMIPGELSRQLPLAWWRKLLLLPLRSGDPLDLFRFTRSRVTQLYLAVVLFERVSLLPHWIAHRISRDRKQGDNPLDRA